MLETSAACLCNFNPHSPEGSDWNPKSEMLRFQEFQSTPPMKGATVHVAYEASHVLISIHAPVKGATPTRARPATRSKNFNPRPREGSDDKTNNVVGIQV